MAGVGVVITVDNVSFDESELTQELLMAMREMEPKLTSALNVVANSTVESLKDHILADVYSKWDPTEYIRRLDGGGLLDLDGNIRRSVSSGEMAIRYLPSGESEQWSHPANGNELIGRIESGNGYEWRRHPGPRPFWTPFVDEMINEKFAAWFDDAMAAEFGNEYESGTVVTRENDDGSY